jgi:hypothetical protein
MTNRLKKIGTGQTKDIDLLHAEELTKFTVKIDEPDSDTAYYGFAEPGTLTSDDKWRILKKTVSGNVTSYLWCDSDLKFDNIWDNRASLTYS